MSDRWKTHNISGKKVPQIIKKETFVSDTSSKDILEQVLTQLKIMNVYLSILTNEEISDVD